MAKYGGQNMATPWWLPYSDPLAIFWAPKDISGGGKNLAQHRRYTQTVHCMRYGEEHEPQDIQVYSHAAH